MESINQLINSNKLFLVAGPCVIEDEQITFEIAQKIKNICKKLNITLIEVPYTVKHQEIPNFLVQELRKHRFIE